MDEKAARAAFEAALLSQAPGFGTFFLSRLLDLDITYAGETCAVKMDIRDWMHNPQGTLHGGLIGTVLDISMGHLLRHVAGVGMTLGMNTSFIRAVKSGVVTAEGSFVRRGRSINYLESHMRGDDGEPIAHATSTWRLLA